MAHLEPETEGAPLIALAEIVRHGRPADILRHALEVVPAGYAGLLERIGEQPLASPNDYQIATLKEAIDRVRYLEPRSISPS